MSALRHGDASLADLTRDIDRAASRGDLGALVRAVAAHTRVTLAMEHAEARCDGASLAANDNDVACRGCDLCAGGA